MISGKVKNLGIAATTGLLVALATMMVVPVFATDTAVWRSGLIPTKTPNVFLQVRLDNIVGTSKYHVVVEIVYKTPWGSYNNFHLIRTPDVDIQTAAGQFWRFINNIWSFSGEVCIPVIIINPRIFCYFNGWPLSGICPPNSCISTGCAWVSSV